MSRYIVCDAPQGSAQWHNDRLGKVTGARCAAIFATVKSGEAATRANLRTTLVLERLTGKPAEQSFSDTDDIKWGREQEPFSRMAYEIQNGLTVRESGFIYLPDIEAGCSLDGFIDDGRLGIWESKSPKSKNHYACLLAGEVPSIYMPQVMHNMWITGAEFCDFTSFDPRMPEKLQFFFVRVERDQKRIDEHEKAVLQFLREVAKEENEMQKLAA